MEYMTYIIIFAIGAYAGFKLNDIIMRWTFGKMLEEAGMEDKDLQKFADIWGKKMGVEEPQGENDLEQVAIKIEQHNGFLYAFRKDNDQFLGQGETKEDLVVRMGEKLRNVNLTISPEDGAALLGELGLKMRFDTGTKEITKNA